MGIAKYRSAVLEPKGVGAQHGQPEPSYCKTGAFNLSRTFLLSCSVAWPELARPGVAWLGCPGLAWPGVAWLFVAQPLPIFVAGGWALCLPLPIFLAGGCAFVAPPLPVLLAGGWAFVVAPLPTFVLTRPASTQKSSLILQKKTPRRTVDGINFANLKKSCWGYLVELCGRPGFR